MSQQTLVLVVPPAEREALRRRLAGEPFEFRTVPHALFSAKGQGVVATLYASGKLVVQGANPELFAARYVATATGAPSSKAAASTGSKVGRPCLGSDETGKGDYFGPLVVCGVRLSGELAQHITSQARVRDSKRLSDVEAIQLGAELRESCPYAIARLDPPEYNALHARVRNLNPMLADLHARVIHELAEPGLRVVVDKFANPKLLEERTADLDIRLEQKPRAESEPAVAAASIIARQEFLACLRELSNEWGLELRKGAGAPTDRAARDFVRRFGASELRKVAKLHFKTTLKVTGGR